MIDTHRAEAETHAHRILDRARARFERGDRVQLDHDPTTVGTVTRVTSETVDVDMDDGSGYHGTDTAVRHVE